MLYSSPLPYCSDAGAYFAAIRDLPWAAWLDSGGSGRFDILVAQPVVTLVTQGESTEIRDSSGVRHAAAEPFSLIRESLGAFIEPMPDIPFSGGALGYWSYDLARRYHPLPHIALDAEHLPEMAVGIYDWAIVLDHQELSARLVSRQRYAGTAQVLPQILRRLDAASVGGGEVFCVQGKIDSNLTPAAYRTAFDAVHKYLHAGDCYQINLAQRYAAQASGDAYAAYLELRKLSPAPYAAFLDWPQVQILCASPERFLQVRQGRVETRPIKGTRPRSSDAVEDARLAQELRVHPKDRAENLMIVDLLRNDLGKCCEPGSVRAPKLFEVESFANVHHLVSTVEGRLQNGCDALDAMRECFPGGSITGAPKQRAMEIIEQLEPHRRGVYCGCIGYVGFDGDMDTNIAIRTLVYSNREIRCWAGGGIVADSQCDAEYQETLDKAAAMLKLLQRFGGKPGR
ncbi:aminodeoxychorismate synthase component I [Sideroxydans lithotrophicus]|uniref:aminodeoxychorismate synthase n=1 Tax=Sideroxydans lithotrophicus (strain ES-1) TaxID=580332 RepID=D5CM15_SIDLE|nr:aminodeoxychorismate synthase component I [Sideroxydans lithotrophicus]ADE10629.1 para-aminobenzoate synthase, subunit I [Sideroxydans lithotrophicus ES-1]